MQDMEMIEGQERDMLPVEIKRRQGLEVAQKWGRRRHTTAGFSEAENRTLSLSTPLSL